MKILKMDYMNKDSHNPDETMLRIINHLNENELTELEFDIDLLFKGEELYQRFCEALENNDSIVKLTFYGASYANYETMSPFFKAIAEHPSLTDISIYTNWIAEIGFAYDNDSLEDLSPTTKIKNLEIGINEDDNIEYIVDLIEANYIETLVFNDLVHVSEEGWDKLANSLMENTSLNKFSIYYVTGYDYTANILKALESNVYINDLKIRLDDVVDYFLENDNLERKKLQSLSLVVRDADDLYKIRV